MGSSVFALLVGAYLLSKAGTKKGQGLVYCMVLVVGILPDRLTPHGMPALVVGTTAFVFFINRRAWSCG